MEKGSLGTIHRSVLIVEDDGLLRRSLMAALQAAGYRVAAAATADEGLELAIEQLPSLVVSDVHLAQGDGRDMLVALRNDERLATSQFVLMTGDRNGVSHRVGMNLGADDYLVKPFTIDEFLACVSARFRRAELFRKAEGRATVWLRQTVTQTLPHELMTPLTSILGLSDVLHEDLGAASAATARDMVDGIRSSGVRLMRTLKNYLTLLELLDHPSGGSLPSDRLSATEATTALRAVAATIARTHGRETDVTITVSEMSGAALPVGVHNFSSIVSELLDNACKFSAAGTLVEARLAVVADAVVLSIMDDGRGMTNEQLSQIGAFRQFDRTRYEQQGLGLGLTLTQHLVERDRGIFRIESTHRKGTSVFASWPRA